MATPLVPGDQVTFINEKQSGVVTRIINNDLVAVDIGDGFEIPTSVKELVRIAAVLKPNAPTQTDQPPVKAVDPAASRSTLLKTVENGTLALGAAPANENAINTGDVAFYLINRTGYELVFTCYVNRNKGWYGMHRGIIADQSVSELGTFSRNELIEIASLLFQGLIYSEQKTGSTATIRKEVPVMLPGFQEKLAGAEGLFAFTRLFTIYQHGHVEPEEARLLKEKFSAADLRTSMQSGGNQKKKENRPVDPDALLITDKIIDLHIEELTDHPSRLSNAEMIGLQMKRFHSEMELAMKSHVQRLIFIHGVGNGTLKNNIRQELREYPGVAFRDADFQRFGSGATEVIFH